MLGEVHGPWLSGGIEHVGSTAVPGLPAKPIIDIMAGVRDLRSSIPVIGALKALGYGCGDCKSDGMHWFCKPSDLERTHHLHLVPFGSCLCHERLAFRNRLRSHVATRDAYLQLKLTLTSEFRDDRGAYTAAKTPFMEAVSAGLF